MKKSIIIIALAISFFAQAQFNVQFHYDMGQALYGSELSNRSKWATTIENFSIDKWGSTYLFVEGYLGNNQMLGAYAEVARELRFWKAPIAIHLEYNGGLENDGSYNDAYLLGLAYNWTNKDYSKFFSVQAMYRYLAHQKIGTPHSWQISLLMGMHLKNGLYSIYGYSDIAHDNSVNGAIVLCVEPQFWFNLAPLKWVDDDCKVSVGTTLEISNNFVWPTNGINNRLYAIPTLSAKWIF